MLTSNPGSISDELMTCSGFLEFSIPFVFPAALGEICKSHKEISAPSLLVSNLLLVIPTEQTKQPPGDKANLELCFHPSPSNSEHRQMSDQWSLDVVTIGSSDK